MKKALVHDWFSVYAGAEKCVESFTNIWDDFEIYSLIDFLKGADRDKTLARALSRSCPSQRTNTATTCRYFRWRSNSLI